MSNPVRTCIGCAQTDDHPRHVIIAGDGVEVTWHQDCHAIATGCESCTEHTAKARGKTGEDFRKHITKHYAALADEMGS